MFGKEEEEADEESGKACKHTEQYINPLEGLVATQFHHTHYERDDEQCHEGDERRVYRLGVVVVAHGQQLAFGANERHDAYEGVGRHHYRLS